MRCPVSLKLPTHRLYFLLLCPVLFCSSLAFAVTVTTLDYPGATSTGASAINNSGDIVGSYTDTAKVVHGFLFSAGTYTTIDVPGAYSTSPVGINNLGQISGYFYGSDSRTHGFLFDGTQYTTLDFPGAIDTAATGLNNAGEIVGGFTDSSNVNHGFTWLNGTFTQVDVTNSKATSILGINDAGILVGSFTNAHGRVLNYARINGVFQEEIIAGQFNGRLNNHNVTVGFVANEGFRFNVSTNAYLKVQVPNSIVTLCYGINDNGTMVGYYEDKAGVEHGFSGPN